MKVLALALACAACAHAAPAAPTTPSVVVRGDIDRAESAERARQHDRARAAYHQAIADAKDPASQHFAHREFAETLETWGEIPAAIGELEAAAAVRPDDAASWTDLGVLYHHEDQDARAIAALERAKQLAPNSPKPRIALASARQCANDRAGAITEYRELLALELPERVRAAITRWLDVLAKSPGPISCKGAGPGPAPQPAPRAAS
jgi:tetratricopeptide (TPR) repeat protein